MTLSVEQQLELARDELEFWQAFARRRQNTRGSVVDDRLLQVLKLTETRVRELSGKPGGTRRVPS